ncbi:MAG: hypothetical protein CMF50_02385 [Legionellales bacterium]|nr:hypothetical protein [Legionellales bacterium]|tara:strand:- start:55246 stop:55770 length:525 start_codon:yes stop_codon:yes gene_type:complete
MTVFINGRSAVHAASGGVLTTTSINYTGAKRKPVTYRNIAQVADLANTAASVFINGNPVAHGQSIVSRSSGDEAGDKGGIYSGTVNGRAEFLTASPNVMIEGQGAARQHDLMVSNHGNTEPAPLQQAGLTNTTTVIESDVDVSTNEDTNYCIHWDIFGPNDGDLVGELVAQCKQ